MKNFLVEKVRIFDVAILLLVIVALGVGFFTYKHFRETASKKVESTANIKFQVFLRGVTITGKENPIKVGDKTFISIRNVPYTDLKVSDVKIDTKKQVIANVKGNTPFLLVDDYSQVFMYDIIVTVDDKAKITKDGAVVGGNKIKIGLPITLEGKDYKFNGTVSSVQVSPQAQQGGKMINFEDAMKEAQAKRQAQSGSPVTRESAIFPVPSPAKPVPQPAKKK